MVLGKPFQITSIGDSLRPHICKRDHELPSDFHGVVYIPFDPAGAWRTQLAQELLGATLTIRLEGLLSN
jgi:hypothetical protein